MYYQSRLRIDPSKSTRIALVPPTGAFKKFFHHLTAGLFSDREEQETFTAVSILQKLNRALRALGITDIVRLASDEEDFYYDDQGIENDLQEALASFEVRKGSATVPPFETLSLVVQHHDDLLDYVVEIRIKRCHRLGEPPITVVANGVSRQLRRQPGEDALAFRNRLRTHLRDQETYEAFGHRVRTAFYAFVDRLERELGKAIPNDGITVTREQRVVRPRKRLLPGERIRPVRNLVRRDLGDLEDPADPLFHGYHGFDDHHFAMFAWADLLHDADIYVHDLVIVDEQSAPVMEVGADGFQAGQGATFDTDQDLKPPDCSDITFFQGHDYGDEIQGADSSGGFDLFSSFGDMDDGDCGDDGGSGCSSCSSCGGCGGCGGD